MSESENAPSAQTPAAPDGQAVSIPKPEEAPSAAPAAQPEKRGRPEREQDRQYKSAWKARSQTKRGPDSQGQQPKSGPVPDLPRERAFADGPRLRDLDAAIEGELQEMMGSLSDKEIYGEPAPAAKRGAATDKGRKKGKVVSVHGPDVFIEVPGGRTQGMLPLVQFPEGAPEIGAEVEVHIEGYDGQNGLLILSRLGAAVTADWSTVAAGMIVEARVTSTNKGGLSVDVNGIRGFMPISQIDLYRVDETEQFVNQKLLCLVTEVNPQEHNLVVSRRALQEKEREEAREKLWQVLAEGQTYEGIVRSVKDFGAFVDLGGVDGLLHVSEMSWARVENVSQVVQVGQKVKVVVLKIDHEKRKLSLGLKQLTASPWDNVGMNFPEGTIAKGKVTRLMDFGAFVELEPGVEGLIHISELAPQRVRRVGDIVQAGQEVQVMILTIDREERRIGLSLKAALPKVEEQTPEEEEEEVVIRPPRPRTTPLRGGLGGE
jgi:ribosomal protein S1